MSPELTPSGKVNEPSVSSKEENGAERVVPPYPGDGSVSPPYFICGPTASGKTAFAIDFALRNNGEIVNADAFQLYRGLEILSAAPSLEEQSQVPHHLYGVLSPEEPNDAQAYVNLATPVIREIRALLAGEIDRAACEELISIATRQYAKRQETWFKRETWLETIRL